MAEVLPAVLAHGVKQPREDIEADGDAEAKKKLGPVGNEDAVAEAFMRSAAASALGGVRIGHGGPFGASIVRDGVIVACAHNMVLHGADPTKHAEMNAIQQACQALGTHDLSDCELYTTCEPCPMCWGAVQWSRMGKLYIGCDRFTAAKYGFDDKVFYDEIDTQSGVYGIQRCGYIRDTSLKDPSAAIKPQECERFTKNMVEVYDGILKEDVAQLFTNPQVNPTLRRRFGAPGGEKLQAAFAEVFVQDESRKARRMELPKEVPMIKHEEFMKVAIAAATRGIKQRRSKEHEPFGAVIVRDGVVLAEGHNTVLESRDATATAEINAIRSACAKLNNHNLQGCDLYCTSHPDLMSLGAVLWARINRVFCGVTTQLAAQCGFEEGLLHFKDLLESEAGRRLVPVVEGVAVKDCEAVFREWSDRNGVIY